MKRQQKSKVYYILHDKKILRGCKNHRGCQMPPEEYTICSLPHIHIHPGALPLNELTDKHPNGLFHLSTNKLCNMTY